MPRSAVSNRQRKAARKTAPKPARSAKPVLVVVAPTGTAQVASTYATVLGEDARRRDAAVALAIQEGEQVGEHGPVNVPGLVAGEFGVTDHREHGIEGRPLRATSRDGLIALHKSGALTAVQAKAGLAFRLSYEAGAKGLGSALGNAGMGGGSRKVKDVMDLRRSAAELHRAYLLVRLNQMERAVADELVDGRELHALRMIAGEGHTVRDVAGSSGHARAATVAALARSLDAIAKVLRITGQ